MIKARIKAENPEANLKSYTETCRGFSWEEAGKEFTWSRTGRLNIVHEAIDRWAAVPEKKDGKALIFERGEEILSFSYGDLKRISSRWAAFFSKQGLVTGDRLFIFLPPSPEIYFALLGCSRIGVIFCPLFSTLGFDELETCISNGEPKAVVTHPDLAERLPTYAVDRERIRFLFTEGPLPGIFPEEVLIPEAMGDEEVEPAWLSPDSPLYLIYTSGSTGPPKGVVHAHGDMVGQLTTARYVLDLREESILWTDADPGWITGLVYGTFAPWLCGATSVVQGDPFTASTWYRTLERHHISVWYTSIMRIRRLVEAGEDLPTRYDLSSLRHVSTVGESLVPELFYWVKKNLGHSAHDTWWMSETGMICLANFPSMDIKPGSMGKPVPGIEAAVVDEGGVPLPPLSMGELALKAPWPAIMKGIWRDDGRYRFYFRMKDWFMTGDMAVQDDEGYFYHQGRIDDLMKVGEKLIGPYDIEQILSRHPAVREAAVISKSTWSSPHLKAFITVSGNYTPSNRLNQEIKAFLRANLSPDVPLKEIEFIEKLPRTSTGKLLRRVLRARELGLPGGDPEKMKS